MPSGTVITSSEERLLSESLKEGPKGFMGKLISDFIAPPRIERPLELQTAPALPDWRTEQIPGKYPSGNDSLYQLSCARNPLILLLLTARRGRKQAFHLQPS